MEFTKSITYLAFWATVMMTALASALPESVPRAEGESSLRDEQSFMRTNLIALVSSSWARRDRLAVVGVNSCACQIVRG